MRFPVTGGGPACVGGAIEGLEGRGDLESVLLPAPGRGSPGCGRQRDEQSTSMPDRSSHGSQLEHLRVADCMHAGVLTCSAATPLSEVAGIIDQAPHPRGRGNRRQAAAHRCRICAGCRRGSQQRQPIGDRPRRCGDGASYHDLRGRAAGPRREADDTAPSSPPDRCRSSRRLPSGHPLDTRHRGPGRREQRAISLL